VLEEATSITSRNGCRCVWVLLLLLLLWWLLLLLLLLLVLLLLLLLLLLFLLCVTTLTVKGAPEIVEPSEEAVLSALEAAHEVAGYFD
jgi:hypothetical protein